MSDPSLRERLLHYVAAIFVFALTLAFAWPSELAPLLHPALRMGGWFQADDLPANAVRDATGALVPCGNYRHIVALEGIGQLLLLVPANRIVAVGQWPEPHTLEGWRVADRPHISEARQVEKIMACRPDLVVTRSQGAPEEREGIAMLRSLGLPVFDLTFAMTLDDYLSQNDRLALLLKVPERGASLRSNISSRCALTKLPFPNARKPLRGVFICTWGERMTVSGDEDPSGNIVAEAGMLNVGAEAGLHLEPVISLEKALTMTPQVLFTRPNNLRAPLDRQYFLK